MQKAFALNLNCLCRYVSDKPPTGSCSFPQKRGCVFLYFRFIGSDSKLHLRGQRALALLLYGAVSDFSVWKDNLSI